MLKALFQRLFIKNWPRKVVSLISAVVIWFIVNQTITVTRTIPDIAIRITNLAPDKTIYGLSSNGLLNKKIAVTLSGNKAFIEELSAEDLEVVINASGHRESWIAIIDKKSLHSTNPEIDLKKHITTIVANDLFIKLSRLVIEDIPLTIMQPTGAPPPGYQFLDIWPKHLIQKVSGPEEQIRALKSNGLELSFSLNRITQEELDSLYADQEKRDEVSYKIPNSWKQISIPFQEGTTEMLNDPRADFLRIAFLKQELISLGVELPITIFFPVEYSQTINPQTYSLELNQIVQKKNGLKLLTIPLYARDVSHIFLNVVKQNLLLIVVAAPQSVHLMLSWTVEFIDEKTLENAFVKASLEEAEEKYAEDARTTTNEEILRTRFREYRHNFELFTKNGRPLQLEAKLNASTLILKQL